MCRSEIHLGGHEFSVLYCEALSLAVGASEWDFESQRFDGNDFVLRGRGAWTVAIGTVENDCVVVGPEKFDELFEFVFLPEKIPIRSAQESGRWED